MKNIWKKINLKIKILVLLCCTVIAGYGLLHAPASDQNEMEQELKNREKELQQQAAAQTEQPDKTQTTEPPAEEKRTVTVIGDSVFLGASPSFLKLEKDAVIDAKISRQVRHGLDVAKKLNKKGQLGNTIILSLGTNSPFNPVTGQELLDYLGKERTIYWINAYGKNLEFQKEVNKTIQELAAKNSNVHLISWAKEAKKHPGWFYQDGTHLNAKGQDGFAKFIWKRIK